MQNQNLSSDSLGRLTYSTGIKRDYDDAGFEAGMSGSDDDGSDRGQDDISPKKTAPPNGKKTKGRVKIKMEFIDNKLRRYTTFSKRKTGIMKKAYELSTLTGTQVMLLVASETGHVYTFATRKLQPMITSETGKSLIQTCLNSPDPLLNSGHHVDQRMSATGFEETEFTYSINDEDQKVDMQKAQTMYLSNHHHHHQMDSSSPQSPGLMSSSHGSSPSPKPNQNPNSNNITMQLPSGAGFAAILTQAPSCLGQSVQLTSVAQNQDGNSTSSISGSSQQHQQHQHHQALYKLAQSLPSHSSSAGSTDSHATVTMVQSSHRQNLPVVSGGMVNLAPVVTTTSSSLPGTAVVYQTTQGVMYATPASGSLSDGVIFNFGQSSPMQLPQESDHAQFPSGGGTQPQQQYITIPLALTSQIVHAPTNLSGNQGHASQESSRSNTSGTSKNVGRK